MENTFWDRKCWWNQTVVVWNKNSLKGKYAKCGEMRDINYNFHCLLQTTSHQSYPEKWFREISVKINILENGLY